MILELGIAVFMASSPSWDRGAFAPKDGTKVSRFTTEYSNVVTASFAVGETGVFRLRDSAGT